MSSEVTEAEHYRNRGVDVLPNVCLKKLTNIRTCRKKVGFVRGELGAKLMEKVMKAIERLNKF